MKPFLSVVIILTFYSSKATNLLDYIPSNTSTVFCLNLEQLNQKSKGLDYLKYVKGLTGERSYYYDDQCELLKIAELIGAPNDYGIELKSNIYYYQKVSENFSGKVYLFQLKDAKKLEDKIMENACEDPLKRYIKTTDNGKVFMTEKMVIGFKNDVLFILVNDSYQFRTIKTDDEENSYDYYGYETTSEYPYFSGKEAYMDSIYLSELKVYRKINDSLMYVYVNKNKNAEFYEEISSFEKVDSGIENRAKRRYEEKQMAILKAKWEAYLPEFELLYVPAPNQIGTNRLFSKLLQENHDVTLFYGSPIEMFNAMINPFYRSSRKHLAPQNPQPIIYSKNISTSYTLDFNNGNVDIQSFGNFNQEAFKYIEKGYDIKQNKDLFEYIDATNLMAYISSATNNKDIIEFYQKFYFEVLNSTNLRKNDLNIVPAMELFWNFVDKDKLFNSVGNQWIFAMNGIIETKVSYKTYDYDENFKSIEKTEERIVKTPKLVFVSAVNNYKNVKEMFDIISKFTVFEKLSDNVIRLKSMADIQFSFFITLTDDVLILTNDYNLAVNQHEGVPKDKRMSKTEIKDIMSHNVIMKVYSNKLLKSINENYPDDSRTMKKITDMAANLGDLVFKSTKPAENSIGFKATLSLNNTSENSFYQLLKIISAND